jgi:proteasome lid subunit RPN8/RPN11
VNERLDPNFLSRRPVEILYLAPGLPMALVELARRAAPREACGLLVGPPPRRSEAPRVDRLILVENVHPDDDAFRVAPRDFLRAQERARAVGDRLLGVFHGHPRSAPIPSGEDLAAMRALGPDLRRIDLIAGRCEEASPGEAETGWELAAWTLGPDGVRRLSWFEESTDLSQTPSESESESDAAS